MFLFKKKISFSQFTADAIFNGMNFYDSNIEKMIPLADEFHVLTDKDKKELEEQGHALIIVDIMFSIMTQANANVTSEDVGKLVGALYIKYLKEVKNISDKNTIGNIYNQLDKLISKVTDSDKDSENKNVSDSDQKYLICSSFANLYSGDNLSNDNVRGKHFAAFKLAKSIVKADFVRRMIKDVNIDYSK